MPILIAILSLVFLWIVFRVSTRAVGPLLADVRAAAGNQQRFLARQPAGNLTGARRGLIQALVVGAAALATYFVVSNMGTSRMPAPIEFSLRYDFTYRYFFWQDFGLVVSLAIGLGLFVTTWRIALAAFVAIYAMLFAYDVAFNIFGALLFSTDSDFYQGGTLGPNLWVFYYALYAGVVAAGLSIFSARYRAVLPWASLIATGAISEYLVLNRLIAPLDELELGYLLAPIVIAAVAGFWMVRPGRS